MYIYLHLPSYIHLYIDMIKYMENTKYVFVNTYEYT